MDPATAFSAMAVGVAAAPTVLAAVGFGSGGVTAGSVAAAVQSTMGGFVAKGGLFALCQSWGAAGMSLLARVAIGSIVGYSAAAVVALMCPALAAAVPAAVSAMLALL